MRLIGIGDVHGCAATLDALLDRLAPRPEDHLVFVGDYVDRGPDSRGVIERLLRLEAQSWDAGHPRCTFLRGNHDQMMLDFVDGTGDFDLWRVNGGLDTLESYARHGGTPDIPHEHVAFLRRTHLMLDTPGFAFVHAGLDPTLSVAENATRADAHVMLWSREHFDAPSLEAWEKPVVCGHTPVPVPLNEPKLIAIDTGAVYAHREGLGRLTAVILPKRTFVDVPYCG